MVVIPPQLHNSEYQGRFIRTAEKYPIDKVWNTINNFSYEEILRNHLLVNNTYGVLCGVNRLVVIDCDCQEIQDELLKIPIFNKTFTVRSATKRLNHFYFITDTDNPESFKCLALDGKTLADIQATGKQVIGPNSVLQDGKSYDVINDVPIAKVDYAILKDILIKFNKQSKGEGRQRSGLTTEYDTIAEKIKERYTIKMFLDEVKEKKINTRNKETDCPFHDSEGHKCFSRTETTFNCYHCGLHGSILDLYCKYHRIPFAEAKRRLAERFEITDEDVVQKNYLERKRIEEEKKVQNELERKKKEEERQLEKERKKKEKEQKKQEKEQTKEQKKQEKEQREKELEEEKEAKRLAREKASEERQQEHKKKRQEILNTYLNLPIAKFETSDCDDETLHKLYFTGMSRPIVLDALSILEPRKFVCAFFNKSHKMLCPISQAEWTDIVNYWIEKCGHREDTSSNNTEEMLKNHTLDEINDYTVTDDIEGSMATRRIYVREGEYYIAKRNLEFIPKTFDVGKGKTITFNKFKNLLNDHIDKEAVKFRVGKQTPRFYRLDKTKFDGLFIVEKKNDFGMSEEAVEMKPVEVKQDFGVHEGDIDG